MSFFPPSNPLRLGAGRHAPPPGVHDPAAAAAGVPLGSAASPTSPEAALLKVAVNSMEALAAVLTAKPVPLSAEDRAAFAAAVKKSMDAVLHCRT